MQDAGQMIDWSTLARGSGQRPRWADLAEDDDLEEAPQHHVVLSQPESEYDSQASSASGRSSPAPMDPTMTAEFKLSKLQDHMRRLERQSSDPPNNGSKDSRTTCSWDSEAATSQRSTSVSYQASEADSQDQVQVRQGFQDLVASEDLSTQMHLIPLDKNGQPTSLGSIAHPSRDCTPCPCINTEAGCQNGLSCKFCHLSHKRQNKMRPCKTKRDRYRQLVSRVKEEIECNPEGFSHDQVKLLPSIESHPELRAKIITSLCAHVQEVKAREGREGAPMPRQLPAYEEAVLAAPWIGKPAGPEDTTRVIL